MKLAYRRESECPRVMVSQTQPRVVTEFEAKQATTPASQRIASLSHPPSSTEKTGWVSIN